MAIKTISAVVFLSGLFGCHSTFQKQDNDSLDLSARDASYNPYPLCSSFLGYCKIPVECAPGGLIAASVPYRVKIL